MFALALAFLFAAPVAAPVAVPAAPLAPRCEIVGVYSEMEWTDADGVYHYDFEATFDCGASAAEGGK